MANFSIWEVLFLLCFAVSWPVSIAKSLRTKVVIGKSPLFMSLIKNLPSIIMDLVKAVPQIITGLVNALAKGVAEFANIGKMLVEVLWNGITSLASWIWDKVSSWASSIWDGICGFFGIHSPSKKFAELGKYMSMGLGIGFVDEMKDTDKDIMEALPSDFDIDTMTHVNNTIEGVDDEDFAAAYKDRVVETNVRINAVADGFKDIRCFFCGLPLVSETGKAG